MPLVHLVPIYAGPQATLLPQLAARLRSVLGCLVEPHQPGFDPELAYDGGRGQYNSRVLLTELRQRLPGPNGRVLGVAGVDLFMPVLTYVFGEAELDGHAAVVSTFRLDNELYGLPPDPQLTFERLVKEAVHELGHTYGLLHCHRGRCVMNSSTYVEGIDLKDEAFCDACARVVKKRLGRR